MPAFSVIMATYGRGRHILPSIRSVLSQSLQDFELIVVGDCCDDDTAAVVQPLLSPRLRWLNLDQRCGSQSYPNNAGIGMSTGRHVAYLGHDDIWHPEHLKSISTLFEDDPQLDFAVGGAIFHGPEASDFRQVTGMFEGEGSPMVDFFPPSSFAHRRDVTERIGPWLAPMEISAPVDADILLRAARAGMKFASTGRVTVHKFAAGHRYLSYLRQSSDEQQAMMRLMATPGYADFVRSELDRSKAQGTFMIVRHTAFEKFEKGHLARQLALTKGSARPALRALAGREVIGQDNLPRALDWQPPAGPRDRVRWVGCNPRPRILVPFTYPGRVKIKLRLAHSSPESLARLDLLANGQAAAAALSAPVRTAAGHWEATATLETQLLADDHSILELRLHDSQRPAGQKAGIGLAEIVIQPPGMGHWPARVRRTLAAGLGRALRKTVT